MPWFQAGGVLFLECEKYLVCFLINQSLQGKEQEEGMSSGGGDHRAYLALDVWNPSSFLKKRWCGGCQDWILGKKKTTLKDKSGVGMSFPVQWWSHQLWKCSRGIWRWYLRTWFRGDDGCIWSPWRSLPALTWFCESCWLIPRIIRIDYIIYML